MKLGAYYWIFYPIFVTLLLLQFSLNFSNSCSSRGGGGLSRRRSRKPLVLGQAVPNIEETSIRASGKPSGKITRNSSKFNSLVTCYSTDIVFKDEEGTGADRIMSKRLRDKLRNLAQKVKEKWRGSTRLRVIEAWDEDGTHAPDSLHYEGRAVDITTSDLDKQKYPELGRLAVEAGFDWVKYQSRQHIHASVHTYKDDRNSWSCFTSSSTVLLESGQTIFIKDVKPGQRIRAMDDQGHLTFTEVLLFLDFNPLAKNVSYLYIETETPFKRLALTENHLIFYKNTASSPMKAKIAGLVNKGEFLMVEHDGILVASRVMSILIAKGDGMIAPLTKQGNLFVDGVLASCYSEVTDHYIAHMAFTPVRVLQHYAPGLFKKLDVTAQQNGLHWFPRFLIWLNKLLGIAEFTSNV